MPSKGFFFFFEEQQEGAEWKGGKKRRRDSELEREEPREAWRAAVFLMGQREAH